MNNPELQEKRILEQKIDYSKIFKIIWSRWYWIAACTIVAALLAYFYLWYTPPQYSTTGSLKFDEKRTELNDLLSSSSNLYSRNNKLQSEGFVIQSRDVLLNAIGRLDYKVSYLLKGKVRTTDVYPNKPFPIEIIKQDSLNFIRKPIDIEVIDLKSFKLSYKEGKNEVERTYKFGDVIHFPGIDFKIKGDHSGSTKGNYSFKFNSKDDFLSRASTIITKEAAKSANVMQLNLTDKNPLFAINLLNAIMKEYVDYDVRQRGTSASQTIDFIERQLSFLYNKVQESGGALEKYKKSNRLIDLSSSTEISMSKYTEQESQKQALKLEELAISQLQQQIENNKDKVSLNFNLEGSIGGLLSGLVGQLNLLIVERDKKLVQFNETSAPIQQLDKQIDEIKQAIVNNIRLLRERNQKTQRYIDSQISAVQQELNNIPSAERDFAKLQSEFDINQKVFSYLSEKRLEAQITRAAVVPGATIVDFATGASVISPVPSKVYTNAILAGFVLGIGLIFLVRVLNPYIYDRDTVMTYTATPIIGVIRKFPGFIDEDNRQALSLQQPKSSFAESVRSVRTNLSFLASEKNSKVICVTSEVAGEGKSFVSVNLASTLALIDKKVVLVGADLRRSKLHRTFNIENKKGLSSYLSRQSNLDAIIHKTSLETLDFIPSGPVPPNPSELLHSNLMRELLVELSEKYDYILLDTAPVGLVSDSIPLIRNSDINIFVIRSGTSRFNAATIPDKLSSEYHLNNVVIVLNAFGDDMLYGNYYQTTYYGNYTQYYYSDYNNTYSGSGYYTDSKKPTWWQFWKKD
ncbi:GumC family protein [Desertivirga arenae]|uniref:GumC family protein n=1 Tax=Desertivirga arenae TaxID=2810309 RepID=UPI001A95792B|nr:polysaccharide biosynthesis tyrosine autokinase [Pedobacter sp. SYSU D00823]